MEPTFGNFILFAVLMVGALVGLITVMFPVLMFATGSSWRAFFRYARWAPLFGLKVGAHAIAPAITGSILAWLTWLSL